jgi:hypothetical protein
MPSMDGTEGLISKRSRLSWWPFSRYLNEDVVLIAFGSLVTAGLIVAAGPTSNPQPQLSGVTPTMKITGYLTIISMLGCVGLAQSAPAADRVRAGQWVGTTIVGGKTFPTSNCMSSSDAARMNGDATAVKAYLETIIPPQICKISDVKAAGNQVIYTASCSGGAVKTVKTVTTAYHGDRFDGIDSTGAKTEAKLVGACK